MTQEQRVPQSSDSSCLERLGRNATQKDLKFIYGTRMLGYRKIHTGRRKRKQAARYLRVRIFDVHIQEQHVRTFTVGLAKRPPPYAVN